MIKQKLVASMIIAGCFFSAFKSNVNANCKIFDMYKNDISILDQYKSYRKCHGFYKSYLYGLPVVSKGVIIDKVLSEEEIQKIKQNLGNTLMCRPDAPFNNWFNLPRGRELKVEDINEFLCECKQKNKEAVLLCFQFPSMYFTGKYMSRYERTGAFNIVIDWEKGIHIDFVGKGFDGGELTKGKNNSHTQMYIPWYLLEWSPDFIWDFANLKNISKDDYELSRKRRLDFLKEVGYPIGKVEESIPQSAACLKRDTFIDLFNNCVRNVLRGEENFNHKVPTMLLVELFETKFYVVEIWDSNL